MFHQQNFLKNLLIIVNQFNPLVYVKMNRIGPRKDNKETDSSSSRHHIPTD